VYVSPLTDHIADAHQHLRICRLALSTTDPRKIGNHILNVGLGELEVTMWLGEMMAVARCNPHASTTPYLAAHAMHKFAVVLQDPQDQRNVMDFLKEVEVMSFWPTEATRQWLRKEWGWPTR